MEVVPVAAHGGHAHGQDALGIKDPATLIVMGSLFAAVALVACWIPARRAAHEDPVAALREE